MKHLTSSTFIQDSVGISSQLWHNTYSNLHSHEFYEIAYVISGKLNHVLNGTQDDLVMGDLRFLTLNDMHDLRYSGDCTHRDILIDKNLFEQLCQVIFGDPDYAKNNFPAGKAVLSSDEISELESLMRKFASETSIDKKRFIGFEAVIKVLKKLIASQNTQEETFSELPQVLKDILCKFNSPLRLKSSVTDIINKTGYNPSYVSRLFKKYMGENLSDYLKNLRLKHVAYYLKTTDLSLREIADIVGIESLSYLNSIFKKKYSMPPMQYRKAHNEKNTEIE